jgi:hypothetical protein
MTTLWLIIPELCIDFLFIKHPVNKIKDKLALNRGGMSDARAMQIGMAADKKLKTNAAVADLHSEIKGTASGVPVLGRGEKIRSQDDPVQADHGSLS